MERPALTMFATRSAGSWFLIFVLFVYLVFCFAIYSVAVEPLYGSIENPTIEADSSTYFSIAGLDTPGGVTTDNLVGFGGSSLGPVTIAKIFRTTFGVACSNCMLFALIVWWAGLIPGVRREYFAVLMIIEPQVLPTLMTLNKEMMAIAGLVSFAAYLYSGQPRGLKRGSKWLLFASLIFSVLARWEQLFVPIWYITMECRWSPFRNKPRRAIVALLLFISAAWAISVHILNLNFGGFISQAQGGGTITKLYAIQDKGGFFLIALPKILMYIGGRWVTPTYFLYEYWLTEPTLSWENDYIGILDSLTMLVVVGIAIFRGRFRSSRPLIHLTMIYFIFTAINPFIMHRYIFPAYALVALELARRKEVLEPAPELPRPPALPPSYRKYADAWARANPAKSLGRPEALPQA